MSTDEEKKYGKWGLLLYSSLRGDSHDGRHFCPERGLSCWLDSFMGTTWSCHKHRKKTKKYTNTVTITCHLPPRTIPDWRRSNRVLIRGLDAAALHCIQRAHCPALNSNAVHGWHGIKVTESINMYSKYSALRRTANDARLILHIQTINHSHWTVAASDLTTHVTPLNCLSQRTCVCVDVRVNMCVDVRVNVCVD